MTALTRTAKEVASAEGCALAETYSIPFQEASAKDGTNVEDVRGYPSPARTPPLTPRRRCVLRQAVGLLSRKVLRRVERAPAADDPRSTSMKLEAGVAESRSRLCPC